MIVYKVSLREMDNDLCFKIRKLRATVNALKDKESQYAKELIALLGILNAMYAVIEQAPEEV